MRKKHFVFLVALIISASAFSQRNVALYGGINASWLNYGKNEYATNIPGLVIVEDDNSLWKIGGDIGAIGQFILSERTLLSTGIGFSSRGFEDFFVQGNNETDSRVSLRYVDIPLMLHGYVLSDDNSSMVSLGGGLQFSYLVGSDVKTRPSGGSWTSIKHNEDFRKTEASLVGSITIQPKSFYLELKGGLGLTSPMEELSGAIPIFVQLRTGVIIF